MELLILSVVGICVVGILMLSGTIVSQLIRIRRATSIRKAARKKGEFLYSRDFNMAIGDVPVVEEVEVKNQVEGEEGKTGVKSKGAKIKKDSKIRTLLLGKRKYLVSENGQEVVEVEPSPYWNTVEGAIEFKKEVIYYKKKEIVIWTSENKDAEKLVKIA